MSPNRRFADLQPASERVGLTERLDEERRAVVAQVSDLSDDELLSRPLAATNLSVGRLIKHLAFVEDRWFQHKLMGLALPEPWCSVDARSAHEWSFWSADVDSAEELSRPVRRRVQSKPYRNGRVPVDGHDGGASLVQQETGQPSLASRAHDR